MSDCSKNAWRVPDEREEGVAYWHGLDTDYSKVDAIVVKGMWFERVRERCEYCKDGKTFDGQVLMVCNHGSQAINFCPNCGAKVVSG